MFTVQFNKRTHNCAGWSVLGVVGEEDDLTMDYIREGEEEEEEELVPHQGKLGSPGDPLNTGYNFRPSDRWRN